MINMTGQMIGRILLVFGLVFGAVSGADRVEALPYGTFGARAMGLGNAFTAMTDDLTSVFWNPAGLGFLENIQITVPYGRFTEDRDDTQGSLQEFQDTLYSSTLPHLIDDYRTADMNINGEQNIGFIFGMPGFGLSFVERSFASLNPHWTKRADNVKESEQGSASYLEYAGLKTFRYSFSFCYGQQDEGYYIGLNTNYIEYKS